MDLQESLHSETLIGKSKSICKLIELSRRVAKSAATVVITGESGTGKEVFAKAIHNWSPRRQKPFVAINCSSIPEALLESELFGHVKGAFTGAIDKRIGLFEEAHGGTLFLDEIGDLNFSLQTKLLRVLQEREIKRVGENQMRRVDVRVIAATHKDLRHEIQKKRFREDLFFRLNVIPLNIPPLRERREDLLPLAEFFLKKFNKLNETRITGFNKSAREFLLSSSWPGNVRELENLIERAVVLCGGLEIDASDFQSTQEDLSKSLDSTIFRFTDKAETLKSIEKKYIRFVYERNNRAKELTARVLGIDRKTLYRKLHEGETTSNFEVLQ